MSDPQADVEELPGEGEANAVVDVRGLGFALTVGALRLLLDPATRRQAEVDVDLSAMSIRVPADAVHELAKRVAPEVALDLAKDQVTVRLPESPAVRITLPVAGVHVGIDTGGVRVGGDGAAGGE